MEETDFESMEHELYVTQVAESMIAYLTYAILISGYCWFVWAIIIPVVFFTFWKSILAAFFISASVFCRTMLFCARRDIKRLNKKISMRKICLLN